MKSMRMAWKIRCLVFAMLVLGGTIVPGIGALCGGDFRSISNECKDFVRKEGPKVPPSKGCCDVLKNIDVPCLCKYVTPKIEAMISIEKAIYVARFCGCQVPARIKCGSYTGPSKG